MKTITNILASAAMLAAFTPLTHAETRVVTQGRAGSITLHFDDQKSMPRHETNVALVMEKPEQRATFKTMGRAGYRIDPARSHSR